MDLARARNHRAGLAPHLAGMRRLCGQNIASADIRALETLARAADWRLETILTVCACSQCHVRQRMPDTGKSSQHQELSGRGCT